MRDPGCENSNVSPTPDQHARARCIAAQITVGLARTGFALPGTLTERMTRCGHPTCRCHADPPRPACTAPTTSGPARSAGKPSPAS